MTEKIKKTIFLPFFVRMQLTLRVASWLAFKLLQVLTPVFWILNRVKPPSIPATNDHLLNCSAIELAKKIRDRKISSESVVKSFIKRIKEVNPFINAVVEDRFEAALREARNCDKILEASEVTATQIATEKPLFGVPFTVKESCSLKGLSHTGCSMANKGNKADQDCQVAEVMRKAGAIPLCVTNTPELCSGFESTNLIYGTTKNPYDGRHSAGGSSGGEGALIGSGASLIGIGSDIAGSIRVPALFNGIFGHKPSSGIIPIKGHYPMADNDSFQKFLVLGPMARYADDLHLAVKIMSSGCDKNLRLDEPIDISKLKVFVIEDCKKSFGIIPTSADVRDSINRAARHLESKGSKIILPEIDNLDESCEIGIAKFFSMPDIPDILVPLNPKEQVVGSLELFKSLFGLSQYTKSAIFMSIIKDLHGLLPPSQVPKFIEKGDRLNEYLLNMLGDDGVLLLPTFTNPAPLFGETVLLTTAAMWSLICNVLGLPATQIPMGLNSRGLPVGFQVVAAPNQDRLCLAVAKELEKAFGGWIPPTTS